MRRELKPDVDRAPDRIHSGSSWHCAADEARTVYRGRFNPGNRDDYLGFRLVRDTEVTCRKN